MHELQIAESVVRMLDDRREGRPVTRVRVRIGRRWTVAPDILEFCFELATVGTPIEGAELELVWRPGRDLAVAAFEVAEG